MHISLFHLIDQTWSYLAVREAGKNAVLISDWPRVWLKIRGDLIIIEEGESQYWGISNSLCHNDKTGQAATLLRRIYSVDCFFLETSSLLASMAPYFPSTSQAVLILVPVHAFLPLPRIQKVGMLEGLVLGPLIFTVCTLSRRAHLMPWL